MPERWSCTCVSVLHKPTYIEVSSERSLCQRLMERLHFKTKLSMLLGVLIGFFLQKQIFKFWRLANLELLVWMASYDDLPDEWRCTSPIRSEVAAMCRSGQMSVSLEDFSC